MRKKLAKWLAFSLAGILVLSHVSPVLQAAEPTETEFLSESAEEYSSAEESSLEESSEEEIYEEESVEENVSGEETSTTEEESEMDSTDVNVEDISDLDEEEKAQAEINDEPIYLVTDITLLDEALMQGTNVGVSIDENTFPDKNFRAYVLNKCDKNQDGVLQASEITACTSISLTSADGMIKDLKGVEFFRYLYSLRCNELNSVECLNVDYNYSLQFLYCSGNQIKELDVSNNKELDILECNDNKLVRLTVGENARLSTLKCGNNALTQLDVSKCTNLSVFHSYNNQLSKLDLSKNNNLVYLRLNENLLTVLNFSPNAPLVELECDSNQLTKLDVSKLQDLRTLHCADNRLTALDVKSNQYMNDIHCNGNQLSQFDISKNAALTELDASNNSLTTLDVSKNTELTKLLVNKNMLEKLDLSSNNKLQELECDYNALTSLTPPATCKNISADNMIYAVELNEDNEINLSLFPGNVDPDMISAMYNCELNGYVLTPTQHGLDVGHIEYNYQLGNNSMNVKLVFRPCEIEAELNASEIYTGKACKPAPVISYGNKLLVAGKDYTLSYKNNVNAATADSKNPPTVIIKGKGNFQFTITKTFDISPMSLQEDLSSLRATLNIEDVSVKYTGKKIQGKPQVTFQGKKVSSSEIEYIYPDESDGAYVEPGVYRIIVRGKGKNFTSEYEAKQYIEGGMSVSKAKIKLDKKSYPYDENSGMAIPNTIEVTVGKEKLTEGKDYTVSYLNHRAVGTATVIITGKGAYTGEKKATYKITGIKLTAQMVEMKITKFEYTGAPRILGTNAYTIQYNGKKLTEGIDFVCIYPASTKKAGKYKVTFKGVGGYTGSVTKQYEVTKVSMSSTVSIKYSGTDYIYRSDGVYPKTRLYLKNANALTEGVDYVLTYKNNKKVATKNDKNAPVIVAKGIGSMTGTIMLTPYTIYQAPLHSHTKLTVTDIFYADKKNNYIPKFTLTEIATGKKLTSKKDYSDISYEYKVGNTWSPVTGDRVPAEAVAMRITIKAAEKGNFSGEISAEYYFYTKQISKVTVELIQAKTYIGQQIRPNPVVTVSEKKDGVTNSVKLVYGRDYVLEYGENINVGTGTVTIRGIGEYGGTKTVKFKINATKMK